MELIPKLFLICLVLVNIFKDSDGGFLENIHERNKIRRAKFLPLLIHPHNFPQQNEYTDYDAGGDTNYEDLNGYSEPNEINYNNQAHSDGAYNVPNNPIGGGYNGNIQNQQINYNAGQKYPGQSVNKNVQGDVDTPSNDNNKNSIIPRPLGSTGLTNPGNVGKSTAIEISNGIGIISDRFGEDSTSVVGEKEKKNDTPETKILKPITKNKFFFQVQPVIPEVDRISAKDIVYYID